MVTRSINFIMIMTFCVTIAILSFTFVMDFQIVTITRQELNMGLSAAGMAGFKAVSFEEIARRNDIAILDKRNITLEKAEAIRITERYIYRNLKLEPNGIAKSDSIISDKVTPVTFNVTVNNSGENGYEYTTIVIEVDVPFKLNNNFGMVSKKIIEIDYSTFLVDSQK